MQHKHDAFAKATSFREPYDAPRLTSTKLSDEELAEALASPEGWPIVAKRMRAAGRI